MKKLLALLVITALTFSACSWNPFTDDTVIDEDENVEETEEEVDEETEDEEAEEEEAYEYSDLTTGGGTATIEFYDPVELSSAEIIENHREYYLTNMPDYYEPGEESEYLESVASLNTFWSAGTFTSGEYAGRNLVAARILCDGPCPASYYRFAADIEGDQWALLSSYSDGWNDWSSIFPYSSTDAETSIPQLDAPETIPAYDNDITYLFDEFSTDYELIGDSAEEIEVSEDVFVKYYGTGCVSAQFPDGIIARYMIVPEDFYDGESDYGVLSKELTYTGMDGRSATKEYALAAGKCGFIASCLSMISPSEEDAANLAEVGVFENNKLYLLEEYEEVENFTSELDYTSFLYQMHSAYSYYQSRMAYTELYEEGADIDPEMSFEEFVADQNIFFLRMESGSYVMVYNADYAPMAECGKPVIYLYPEEETEVNVQVGIDEFTITDPQYGEDGWNVIAQPDSTLTNLADGLEYPYLFWEGTSEKELAYEPGWTLTKKEVVKVLPTILMDMGLNETETADFMEFWQPRLLDEPGKYVEFSFVPQSAFDEVAPLTITPAPDQVIRIFMIYKGTDQEGLSVPDYVAPKRYGFTVVEWGGDLH